MIDKAGLYYHKPYDFGDRQLHAGMIRHWRRKLITIGEKKFLRFYPARADYSQPRCIRNRISRESQKTWNDRSRKETCRFLFLNNLPHGHGLDCSYIAGDQMNIGLLLLHSDADLTVSMDRQYIDYVVFFGSGCDRSTLTLDAYAGSSQVSDIYQAHVYDANAEFYSKSIQSVYFLIAPDEAPYERFYQFFDRAENLLRNHHSDFADPEMLPYLPDKDSDYWERIDAALVWSQLMPYYNISPAGMASDGVSTVYDRSESNVPYIYYHAAYIVKVRVLNAYGSTDGQLPDYIKNKNWASPNPFMTGTTVRLCENGGCSFNHNMSMGTVSFRTSIRDIPDK